MANLKTLLQQRSGRGERLRTGRVTQSTLRGLIITDDVSGAKILISGSARIGQRISYRYGAMVSQTPAATIEIVSV